MNDVLRRVRCRCPVRPRFRVRSGESHAYGRPGYPGHVRRELPEASARGKPRRVVAVATNSKANIYVYHRRDTTACSSSTRRHLTREIGKATTASKFAHSVRVDKEDNIWTVDEGPNLVTSSARRAGADGDRPQASGRRRTRHRPPAESSAHEVHPVSRRTCWDRRATSSSPTLLQQSRREVRKNGACRAGPGSGRRGTALGESICRTVAGDERSARLGGGSGRIIAYQELGQQSQADQRVTNLGRDGRCAFSPGPHQYVSSRIRTRTATHRVGDNTGEIYKAELDGACRQVGSGKEIRPIAGRSHARLPKSERGVLGEIEWWRVQKYILSRASRPSARH